MAFNKTTALFLVALIFSAGPVLAETVKMAVFKLEPFMMKSENDGVATGVTVDYWKDYLAPEMGIELEVLGVYPLKRVIKMLKHGEVDTVSQLTRIPEREALFLYPDTPLTEIVSCLIVRKDSPIESITDQAELFGLRIGFIEAGYIPPILVHDQIHIDKAVAFDFRDLNHRKLMGQRVDALLDINCISARYFYQRSDYQSQVRFIYLPTDPVGVNSIFRKDSKGQALRKAFEKAHKKLQKNNTFEMLSKEYLNKDM